MNADLFIDSLFGKGYLKVPKVAIRAFGGARALFLAFLYDLSEFAKIQGNDDFFATREKTSNDLGFSERVCDDYFKYFRENGVLIGYRKGINDPKKYYKIDNQRLSELLIQCEPATADSAYGSNRKNCEPATADSACAIYKNKQYEQEQRNKNKENTRARKNARELFLDFAKKEFENAKPANLALNDFLEWVEYKIARCPKMTNLTIKKNLNQLIKMGDKATDSIQKSILNGWQGLFMPKDDKSDFNGDILNLCEKDMQERKKTIRELENFFYGVKKLNGKEIKNFKVLANGDVFLDFLDRTYTTIFCDDALKIMKANK